MTSASTLNPAARLLLLLAGCVALIGAVAGCATGPGGFGSTATELHTAIDDSPERARARTRLTLATSYYENNQSAIALDELKKVLQVDPSFGDAYNLSALLYKRGDYPRAQFYIRRLNNGEMANAESLWLGIKVERKLNNRPAMEQLASQMRRRFSQSREFLAYERGAFDD